jgi:HEAT repeat protein
MIAIPPAKTVGYVFMMMATLEVFCPHPQFKASAQAAPSLQQFFQTLVQRHDPASLPKFDDVLKVTDQIAGLRPEDISKALPAIFRALGHQDDNVKIDAAFTLTVITRRPDSAQLLGKYIDDIADLFNSQDPRLQGTPTLVFLNLKPTPPPEVLPPLLTFLKRADRDPQAQSSAVFALVHIAPENPDVIAAIQEVLSRPLDNGTRVGVLNALGNRSIKDVHLVATVIASMGDPDPGIRSTAIQALTRMGQQALVQAEPTLRRLADDPKQPADVTAAAKEALQRIHPPK